MEELITPSPNQRMGRTAARGALATIGGQAARFVIQVASIVILSRVLGPATIGLFAALLVIVSFGEVLRDFGLSSAVIQAKHVTQAQLSNLFWLNTLIGILLAVISVVVAPLIASFYREPRLSAACAAIGVVFVFSGVGTQFRAQLTRELKFATVTVIDIVAALSGMILAVPLALSGAGIWALVAQQGAIAAGTALLNMGFARWWPSLPARKVEIRQFITFGWHVGCIQLLNAISKNVDNIVIGRFFGPSALGIYSRAFDLMSVPLNQLSTPATKVAFPVLAQIRDDTERYNRFLLVGQRVLVHTVGFLFVFTLALAPALIEIALGEQWSGVSPIFRILAVGALAQAASFATYWVFLSQGKTRENLRLALVTRTTLVLGVICGALFGVFGVAIAYSSVILLTWPFSLYWLHRVCPNVPTRRMFGQIVFVYAAYGVAGAGAFAASQFIVGAWMALGVGAAVYVAIIGLVYWAVGAFRRDVREVLALRHLVTSATAGARP